MAAMPRELKVTTLEGGDLTVEVMPTTTIKELKAMLREKKHCEDPIERQILKVDVLAVGLLVDNDQTLESAGLLHAESEVTAIFCRNEVKAATKEAIHAEGLLQVNIPSSLKEIDAGAFASCDQVLAVAIPDSVTRIWRSAFANCCSLKSITIPHSVTDIEEYAFLGCCSLESITIPDSVTSITTGVFQDCTSLTSITIPESVHGVLGMYAFANCSSLASIRIPHVYSIRKYAFQGCKSLQSITLGAALWEDPPGAWSIEPHAFEGCSSLDLESIFITMMPEFLMDDGEPVYDGKSRLQATILGQCGQ